MKLFALGATWAVYVLLVVLSVPQLLEVFAAQQISISTRDYSATDAASRLRRRAYDEAVDRCVSWTKTEYILDDRRGASHGVRCATAAPVTLVLIFAALLVIAPVAALRNHLKRAARN